MYNFSFFSSFFIKPKICALVSEVLETRHKSFSCLISPNLRNYCLDQRMHFCNELRKPALWPEFPIFAMPLLTSMLPKYRTQPDPDHQFQKGHLLSSLWQQSPLLPGNFLDLMVAIDSNIPLPTDSKLMMLPKDLATRCSFLITNWRNSNFQTSWSHYVPYQKILILVPLRAT